MWLPIWHTAHLFLAWITLSNFEWSRLPWWWTVEACEQHQRRVNAIIWNQSIINRSICYNLLNHIWWHWIISKFGWNRHQRWHERWVQSEQESSEDASEMQMIANDEDAEDCQPWNTSLNTAAWDFPRNYSQLPFSQTLITWIVCYSQTGMLYPNIFSRLRSILLKLLISQSIMPVPLTFTYQNSL